MRHLVLGFLICVNSLWRCRSITIGNLFVNNIPAWELDSLQMLYSVTHGENWAWGQQQGIPWNFTADANPCLDMWEGVFCSTVSEDSFLHVDALQLTGYNLEGFLPASVANLTQLKFLNLSVNILSGAPIPTSIGNLRRLEGLELDHCYIAGPIPQSLSNISSLVTLNLEANDLSGSLMMFCSLRLLVQLSLAYNHLNGTFPSCMVNMTSLQTLNFENNDISGSIPESFGNLRQLSYFNAGLNRLSGSIPDSFRYLTSLAAIMLGWNSLSGTLPDLLTTLLLLEHLELSHNQFSGGIPARIGDLTKLRKALFRDNLLNGTLPASLTLLTLLDEFNAETNFLTGTLPAGFERMTHLRAFDLRYNQLSGTLAPQLLEISTLYEIFLQYNHFTGSIPDVVSSGNALEALFVSRNILTGPFPGSVLNSSVMFVVDIAENFITGSLPAVSVCNATTLFFLSAGINHLTGTFPAFDGSYGLLAYLNMSTNYLTGTVPASLGGLYSMNFLYMYNNLLTGTFPDVWGNMQGLSFLTADDNLLTGTIPRSLGDAEQLQSLNLSYNHLTGTIPQSLAQLTHLSVLLLMNNALTGGVNTFINPLAQKSITTLQVSDNQLTGPLPEYLDLLPELKVFAAVSNCFTGSIPLSLCDSASLVTLALDGLQAATSCQQSLFPAALEGTVVANALYSIRSPLSGGVPACLFSMSNLTTLHLSGNELTGSLPPDLELGTLLLDLSLSHNKITGNIPAVLLQRNWRNLDLSYNVFVGSLDVTLPVYKPTTALNLGNNRLSGVFPGAFVDLDNVNVLESNLFSCKADRSDLPRNDPNQGKYDCASTNFDDSLYAWLSVVGCVAMVIVVIGCSDRFAAVRENATQQLRIWLNACGNDTPRYAEVAAAVQRVLQLGIASAIYIILILLPIYAACTAMYGTYEHQYAYTISAAYLSGTNSFAWMSVFQLVMWLGIAAALGIWLERSAVNGSNQFADATPSVDLRRRSFVVYILTAMLNFFVVLGVNTAYVIIALNRNGLALTFTQIALALFKVAFNGLCSPALLRWTSQRFTGKQPSPASFVTVQLFVSIVNNILVPCLVVSIVSPNCFYNIFRTAAQVNTEFSYDGKCLSYAPTSGLQFFCIDEAVAVAQTSYSPPFDYSYQCSSSFITYYAPAYVIMCIIAGFALPAAQVVLQRLHARAAVGTRWFTMLDVVLPRVLKPLPITNQSDTMIRNVYVPIFDASQHLITLLTYSALLLTYGAVFPPLAVCFVAAMAVLVVFMRLKVGRFLVNAREANQPGQVAIVEQECAGVGEPAILVRAVSMIAVSAGVFYTLFLFDTLGDRWGLKYAYWVLIVTPLLAPSALLLALYYANARAYRGSKHSDVGVVRQSELELPVIDSYTMSPLPNASK